MDASRKANDECRQCARGSYCKGTAKQRCLSGVTDDFKPRSPSPAKRAVSTSAPVSWTHEDFCRACNQPRKCNEAEVRYCVEGNHRNFLRDPPGGLLDSRDPATTEPLGVWLTRIEQKLDAILAALQQQKKKKKKEK